jgi:hypothetical protein
MPHGAPAAPSWFGHVFNFHLGGRPVSTAPPARYAIDTGGAFILDRGDQGPLLKFSDSPEVWVLTTARGPRGDVIFSDDIGRPMLRTTKFGGVTVFTRAHPGGSAAAQTGASAPLSLSPVGLGQLNRRLTMYGARASRAVGHAIGFQADVADPASNGVVADAALVASEAVVELSGRSGGRAELARVRRVHFEIGRAAAVALHDEVIRITVAASAGRRGRPSSARILKAIGATA